MLRAKVVFLLLSILSLSASADENHDLVREEIRSVFQPLYKVIASHLRDDRMNQMKGLSLQLNLKNPTAFKLEPAQAFRVTVEGEQSVRIEIQDPSLLIEMRNEEWVPKLVQWCYSEDGNLDAAAGQLSFLARNSQVYVAEQKSYLSTSDSVDAKIEIQSIGQDAKGQNWAIGTLIVEKDGSGAAAVTEGQWMKAQVPVESVWCQKIHRGRMHTK